MAEINKTERSDMELLFSMADRTLFLPSGGYWKSDRYYVEKLEERRIYYCPTHKEAPYACTRWNTDVPKTIFCQYVKGKESYLNYSHNLCDIMGLETLLLNHAGLLLHSSFIRWNSQGLLFSAPSGTGKSTQADLWVKYEGAEIINGDRAGLRKLDKGWTAYGLPYAGSSGVYRNESAPVKSIIVLRQAKENRIRPLGPAEAVRYLYPEITVHQWDSDFVKQVMDLLTDLVLNIPIYLLECLPDQGAVDLVKRTIFEK